MSKKKIMTIFDLYNFCEKNKFYHFNSTNSNEEICVQMPAIFEKEETVDKNKEGLTPFVAKAYHDHINLNKSEIKPEILEETLPSAMLRPILANVVIDEDTGEKDFGSHDFTIEEDDDGNEYIHYIEQPVGVIFGDNTIEYDEEDDVNRAILHGYLYDGYCQDAVDIMNRRKTVDCSVELSVREMSYNAKDKVLTLDDFYVSGLTLLGSKVNPGMKGSKVTIEDFSKTNNSMFSNNDELLNELKKLNENLSHFNINKNSEEGGNHMTKFEELLLKYSKTVEDISFDYENMSEDELESAFAEAFDDESEKIDEVNPASDEDTESDVSDDTSDEEVDETEVEADDVVTEYSIIAPVQYSVSLNNGELKTFDIALDEIQAALYNLVNEVYAEDNTWYSVRVFETYVIMDDWYNSKIYRQSYSRDGENFTLTGDRVEVFINYLTKDEETALNEMKSNYSVIEEKLASYEKAENDAKKDEIFADEAYADYLETDEFKQLMSEKDNYSVDELRNKAEVVFAKAVRNLGFSAKDSATKDEIVRKQFTSNVDKLAKDKKKNSPYGSLKFNN